MSQFFCYRSLYDLDKFKSMQIETEKEVFSQLLDIETCQLYMLGSFLKDESLMNDNFGKLKTLSFLWSLIKSFILKIWHSMLIKFSTFNFQRALQRFNLWNLLKWITMIILIKIRSSMFFYDKWMRPNLDNPSQWERDFSRRAA